MALASRTAMLALLLLLAGTPPAAAQVTSPVTEFTVNGLKVLVKHRASSQTVVVGLFLRGGVRGLTAETAGIETLMLDVGTEASAAYPRDRMRRELARTGAALSFGASRDYSTLTLASPRRHFDDTWPIFTDAALRPSFAADDVERAKSRRVAAMASLDDTPDAFVGALQARAAFAGHPYAHDPEGTPASIRGLTADGLRRHHRQVMVTSRLLLVVVGDVDAAEVRRRVESAFGATPRGGYREAALPPLAFRTPTVFVEARDLPTNYVSGVYAAPAPSSADFHPMQVATTILRDRVFEEVRAKRNLSYAPDAFLSSQAVNTGGLYFTAVDANLTVQVMLGEITRLQREDVPAGLIRSTGQGFLTNSFVDQETNSAQTAVLAQQELVGGGWRNADLVLDRIRAVTPADVRRVATTYMRNLQFVVLGDPRRIDREAFTGTRAP